MSNKTIKVTNEQLNEYVDKKIMQLIEADMKSDGDPAEVKMNKMVSGADAKPVAKVSATETKSANVAASDATKVVMNTMDKEQGSDGSVSAAVKVEAGGEIKSKQSATAGMKDKNATSKTNQPAKDLGAPFNEDGETEMNSMDKEVDEGTKTYVETGSEGAGSQATTVGQKKAVAKESAPESTTKETEPRISDAIQMPEGKLNKKELINFAINEAKKIKDLI
jgi:hypothetical protein|tara:strand:+ start:30025 stop:30690 length:666 start_codon:yes stop_codon:yes gene_type:complete